MFSPAARPRHDLLPVIGFGLVDVVAGGLPRAVHVSGLDRSEDRGVLLVGEAVAGRDEGRRAETGRLPLGVAALEDRLARERGARPPTLGTGRSNAGLTCLTRTFQWVGARFTGGEVEPVYVAAHCSGDVGVTIGFGRGLASIDNGNPGEMVIRATHVYRSIDASGSASQDPA